MDLSQARETIDRLDRDIAMLLQERFRGVDALSDYKARNGLAVYDPAREQRVTDRLKALCGPDVREDVAAVYEQLFLISRARQELRRARAD